MLLLLTNSMDGSSDVICRLCVERAIPCFRFNVDLFQEYKFQWRSDGFRFVDPSGRIADSKEISATYWRKPHFTKEPRVERLGSTISEWEWAETQVLYIVQEVANWCRERKLVRLVEPRAERRIGKVSQMLLAERYFRVPAWQTGWGCELETGRRIVKSLDARLIDDGRFLYARSVELDQLDTRFPWLIQHAATGSHDATVVFVAGNCYGFRFSTPRDGILEDWRRTINTKDCVWAPWPLSKGVSDSIRAFMNAARLKLGRLDFVISEGDECFLEVNPNGQYGWLDNDDLLIHRSVLEALFSPAASID